MEQDPRASYGHSRARSKSSFSFKSNKSDHSDPSRPKVEVDGLKESESTKTRSKWALQSARDPNKALREEQPALRNLHEARTLPTLREGQLRDWKGDPINDPDASNPTRSRMERPLDTIRSFEAAIDSNYQRKAKSSRPDTADMSQASRRNSYAPGSDAGYGNRMSTYGGNYNGGRGYDNRGYDNRGYDARGYSGHRESYSHRPGMPRHATAPTGPHHNYNESYDTIHTGESYGTSGSEPWTNSTDPSSENSSVDRIHGGKPEYNNDAYGNYGRHDAIEEEYGYDGQGYDHGQSNRVQQPQQQYASNGRPAVQAPPPPPPKHDAYPPQRNVIPLGGNSGASGSNGAMSKAAPPPPSHGGKLQRPPIRQQSSSDDTKRKSWLKRRFSRN